MLDHNHQLFGPSQGLSIDENQTVDNSRPTQNEPLQLSNPSHQTESSAHPFEAPPAVLCEEMEEEKEETPTLLVFGYGSLMWKQNFQYSSKIFGYIKDYARRFEQGNVTMRGVPEQPGRVANIVEAPESKVWGVAFKFVGHDQVAQAKQALYSREVSGGGYVEIETAFFPRQESITNSESAQPMNAYVYTATKDNPLYMGQQDLPGMARQIARARGPCGTNAEYVTKTADFVRQYIPEDDDEYLFELNRRVKEELSILSQSNSPLEPTPQHLQPSVRDVMAKRPRVLNHGQGHMI